MKTIKIKIAFAGLMLMLSAFSAVCQQHVTMSLKNISSTNHTLEYDLFIVNDGQTVIRLGACSYGINFSSSILNNGTLSCSYSSNSQDQNLKGLGNYAVALSKAKNSHHVQMTNGLVSIQQAPNLVPHISYKIGRFKLINSAEWTSNSLAALSLQASNQPGYTTTQILGYVGINQHATVLTPSLETVALEVEIAPILNEVSSVIIHNNQGQQLIENQQVNVYPNPVNDVLYLQYNPSNKGDVFIQLLDLQGRVIKRTLATSVEGLNTFSIDVHDLSAGIYLVQMKDTHELNYLQNFSKQ